MKCGQRRRRVKTFNFDANQLSAVDLEKSNSSQASEREKRANSIENRVWNWFWRNLQFHTIYHLSPAHSDSDWKVRIFGMHRKLILQFERVEKKFFGISSIDFLLWVWGVKREKSSDENSTQLENVKIKFSSKLQSTKWSWVNFHGMERSEKKL